MAFQGASKMSMVAQYDDLCRYTKILTTGSEEEFKTFVESQLNCVRKWKDSDAEKRRLMDKVASLEGEKKKLETQMKHMRSIIQSEVEKRNNVEKEKAAMERQITLIREVLLADATMDNKTKEKLAFLNSEARVSPPRNSSDEEENAIEMAFSQRKRPKQNLTTIEESGSMLSLLTDVDQTGDLDYRFSDGKPRPSKGKRRSSEKLGSPKRRKSDERIDSEAEYGQTENGDLPFKNINRCNSEPANNADEIFFNKHVHRSDSDQFNKYKTYDLRRNVTGSLAVGSPFNTQKYDIYGKESSKINTPVGRYSTGGKLSRSHYFSTKTCLRTEKCVPCGHIIKFFAAALKCNDCRIICHIECKDLCPLPCIPTVNTPTKGSVGSIADYVSNTPPMIPSLIVHCVNEIEARGLKEIGLYRISGADREVKDLKDKFLRGRSVPCLNQVDIHAVCGTVKEFLRSLKEPLIPRSAWQSFVEAAELNDLALSLNALYEGVVDLPQANRDTLAFMILHLQRVAESEYCKMPADNIAKVFGPTILGYSSTDPRDANMFGETQYQYQVVKRFLSIPADSWQTLLNSEPDVFQTVPSRTPETTPAPKGTRLGPIHARGKNSNVTLAKTPLTPRNLKHTKSSKNYFASPYLK